MPQWWQGSENDSFMSALPEPVSSSVGTYIDNMAWTDGISELQRFSGMTPEEVGREVIKEYNYVNPGIETFNHVQGQVDFALGVSSFTPDRFTNSAWRKFWEDSFYIFDIPREKWGMREWELFHGISKSLYYQVLYA